MRFAVLVSTLAAFAAAAPAATRQEGKRGQLVDALATATDAAAATRQEGKRGQLVDALATATDAVDDATNALATKRHATETEGLLSKGKRQLVNLTGALKGVAGVVQTVDLNPLPDALSGADN